MKKQMGNKLRGSAGFTLVELVVVIAIIGILAGIGTVGYGGYVKKANEAADQQLLGEVNTAFAAACVENGTEIYAVNDAKLDKDTAALSDVTIDGAKNTKIPTSYEAYLGETNGFKVIEPKYSNYKHIFVDGRNNVQYAYGGGAVTISGKDAANLKDSTFADPTKHLGVDNLLEKVNNIAGIAHMLAEKNADGTPSALSKIWNSEDFLRYAGKAVGLTDEKLDAAAKGNWSMTNEDLMAALGAKAEKLGMDVSKPESFNKLMSNATILYAAKDTKNIDQNEIKKLLTSNDGMAQIKANLNDSQTMGKALSQASLLYGMYTAYIYSGDKTEQEKEKLTESPLKAMGAMEDQGFKDYINSEQGAKDLNAYLSAMNMINSSVDDPQAVTKLLKSGFADQDLKDLLNNSLQ